MTFNARTLPSNDNVNPYSFCVDVASEMFIQKGKMIAYYGSLRFEAISAGPYDALIRQSFNSPLYANDFVVVTGHGKLILGDRGYNISSFDLEDGNLTVRSPNMLGFDPSLICQESTVPGYLTFLGTGKFLASSNGEVHFLEPPSGWTRTPSWAGPTCRRPPTATTTVTCAASSVWCAAWSQTGPRVRRGNSTSPGKAPSSSSLPKPPSGAPPTSKR